MTKVDFNAGKEQAEKTYNLGKGEYFKLKNGDNRIRLVSECLPHEGSYQGKPTFKWLCQVIDLVDGKVKPFFMSHNIYKQICSLQMDKEEGYDFDEVPMPYSVNIVTENAGEKTIKTTVRPSSKRVLLTVEQLKEIEATPTVQELQKRVRDNDAKKDETPAGLVTASQAAEQINGEDTVDGSEIPF